MNSNEKFTAWVLVISVLGIVGLKNFSARKPPILGQPLSIIDRAQILNPAATRDLQMRMDQIKRKTAADLKVVILPSLNGEAIESCSGRFFKQWRINQVKGMIRSNGYRYITIDYDNRILLLVISSEHKARIEVGRLFEPILNANTCNSIVEGTVIPLFRSERFDEGINAGLGLIAEILYKRQHHMPKVLMFFIIFLVPISFLGICIFLPRRNCRRC